MRRKGRRQGVKGPEGDTKEMCALLEAGAEMRAQRRNNWKARAALGMVWSLRGPRGLTWTRIGMGSARKSISQQSHNEIDRWGTNGPTMPG